MPRVRAALKIRRGRGRSRGRGRGRSRGQGDLDDEDEHGRERDNETERASADEPVGGAAGGERTEGGIQAACRRDRVFPRPHGHASIRRSSIDRAGYHRVAGRLPPSSCPALDVQVRAKLQAAAHSGLSPTITNILPFQRRSPPRTWLQALYDAEEVVLAKYPFIHLLSTHSITVALPHVARHVIEYLVHTREETRRARG